MNIVDKLIDITESLLSISASTNPKERDEQIQKIESLLNEREQLMKALQPPFSKEEKEKGQKLLELNQKLQSQLESLKMQIKKDIIGIKTTKNSAKNYINPYQHSTIDGMFYDKRK